MTYCEHLLEVCCDYGICVKALEERFGVEASPMKVVAWIENNLIDMQEPTECEECERGRK